MCSTARHRSFAHARSSAPGRSTFAQGSAVPGPDHLRASDAEREATVDHLRAQAAAGRLDIDEFTRRIDAALTAVTIADLRAVTDDLPERDPRSSIRAVRRTGDRPGSGLASSALATYIVVSLMLVTIWALTGAGYFWPVWPILGWGLCVVPGRHRAGCAMRHRRREGYAHGGAPASTV